MVSVEQLTNRNPSHFEGTICAMAPSIRPTSECALENAGEPGRDFDVEQRAEGCRERTVSGETAIAAPVPLLERWLRPLQVTQIFLMIASATERTEIAAMRDDIERRGFCH